MFRISRCAAVCSALTWWACAQRTEPVAPSYPLTEVSADGEQVAKIGPVTLTTRELDKRITQQSPALVERISKELDRRKEFIQQQVRFEVLAQEGWARKMYQDPEVISELKKAIVQKLIREELDKRAKDQSVSENELREAYEKARDEFNKPETIRLQQVVRPASDDKQRVAEHALLNKVMKEVTAAEKQNRPGAFTAAAKDHSLDEPTKNNGGELPFMTRAELEQRYGPEVAKAMFESATVGDMVVADAPNAVVLFKKAGFRRAVERSLDQVRPQLRARVLRDKRNQAFEALMTELEKKHSVTIDQALIERMGARTPPAGADGGAP